MRAGGCAEEDCAYVAIQIGPAGITLRNGACSSYRTTPPRALPAHVAHYTAFPSRLNANVLAIDYRGFADSTGTPSEEGLLIDARAAWDWLLSKGHSLGTDVAAKVAAQLA